MYSGLLDWPNVCERPISVCLFPLTARCCFSDVRVGNPMFAIADQLKIRISDVQEHFRYCEKSSWLRFKKQIVEQSFMLFVYTLTNQFHSLDSHCTVINRICSKRNKRVCISESSGNLGLFNYVLYKPQYELIVPSG